MATTEHSINDALAELLRGTRFAWRGEHVVRSETTQVLAESAGLRPDILITEPHTAPVVIETEVLPAQTVDADAVARLNEKLSGSGRTILSSIALRLPRRLRDAQSKALSEAIMAAQDLEFALYTVKNDDEYSRLPEDGWLIGGLFDLSMLAQSATLPPLLVERATNVLEIGISEAAGELNEIAKTNVGTMGRIAELLHQQDSPQTRRMAATIMANAFMYHEALAGSSEELKHIQTLDDLRSGIAGLRRSAITAEWRKILEVNYWSIFYIATRLLAAIPVLASKELLGRLSLTAEAMLDNNLMRSHDLTGAVFQRLISDRKFLAAFYTKPASAALLVGLAVNEDTLLADKDWSDSQAITSLRIADFSCGTGTLLSTAYQRLGQLHELHGGDSSALHSDMMANVLLGCDILPAAAHLTASMLSSAHPSTKYEGSRVFTLPYGRQEDGSIALGSIDLLDDLALMKDLQITARTIQGAGEDEKDAWRQAPHISFDLVIMNPPFTRATNHERRIPDTPNPNFAAFGASAEEQKEMAAAARIHTKGTLAHGNAGEASVFLALADRKLAKDGMLAMVMPLTLLSGSSWEKCRVRLAGSYEDLIVVTVAGVDSNSLSFSADTGMGECLIIGKRNGKRQSRATFVVLNEAPSHPLLSKRVADQVRMLLHTKSLQKLEGGPYGGSAIYFGEKIVGNAINAPLPNSGSWKLARIADLSLAQSSHQLAENKKIWLPTQQSPDSIDIAMTTISDIGSIGPYHLDVSKRYRDGKIRGPFEVRPLQANLHPTYPILWAHDAKREQTMSFEADREGVPFPTRDAAERRQVEYKMSRVFQTASHCHSNLDFRFNGQSTAMQFTQRKTIGGRAWISIQLPTVDHEKALVLWGNTSLGLLMFWWHSSKQHPGRGILTKTTLATLPILDVTSLSETQLQTAARIFDETCDLPLKPLHELHIDENRKLLDRRFYGEVLGLPDSLLADNGPLDILRGKLSQEPSIRGSKPPP